MIRGRPLRCACSRKCCSDAIQKQLRQCKDNLYNQPASLQFILCADGAAMNLNGAFSDRQTESGALGIAVGNSPEWQEYVEYHIFRHSRSVIANTEKCLRPRVFQGNFDCCSFGGMTDGIPHDILHGTSQ
jgi:hypothetical protein